MRNGRLTAGIAATAAVFAFLWQQIQATRLGYEVGEARAVLRRQREANEYLRLELAGLNSPERLAREAQARLGMSPPTPESLIVLGSPGQRLEAGRPEPDSPTLLVKAWMSVRD